MVESKSTSAKFESCLDWLIKSDMISLVHRVEHVVFPLDANQEEDHFRVYPTDIGLLLAAYPYLVKGALLEDPSTRAGFCQSVAPCQIPTVH